MRMEELANNNFIKGTDSVERYLLDIVKKYFNTSGIADEDSKEYIIQKAVERMKEELYIDNAGVISVNGQTGVVDITLEDLGGEPLISPKYSAFNVGFGKEENTACEGNDSRLSNKRNPLSHSHSIDEINGLSGELSTISNNINLLGNKTHKHDNKGVLDKLTYTGSKDYINLDILDTANNTINDKTSEIDNSLTSITSYFNTIKSQLTETYNQYQEDYNNTIVSIETKGDNVATNTNTYADNLIEEQKTYVDSLLNDKITKTQYNDLISIINKGFQTVYEITLTDIITTSDTTSVYEFTLPEDITTILMANDNYKIDFKIKYIDPITSKENESTIPFLYAENGILQYSIGASVLDKEKIRITGTRFIDTWSTFLSNAVISCKINIVNSIPEV